jgi:hypothetical protein
MTAQLDQLMERLRSVETEIEVELTKRREELRFRLENSGLCSSRKCCESTGR